MGTVRMSSRRAGGGLQRTALPPPALAGICCTIKPLHTRWLRAAAHRSCHDHTLVNEGAAAEVCIRFLLPQADGIRESASRRRPATDDGGGSILCS